jgi:hypothetical protein
MKGGMTMNMQNIMMESLVLLILGALGGLWGASQIGAWPAVALVGGFMTFILGVGLFTATLLQTERR